MKKVSNFDVGGSQPPIGIGGLRFAGQNLAFFSSEIIWEDTSDVGKIGQFHRRLYGDDFRFYFSKNKISEI